ncbi:MAG: restriction endonuclease subunit S [Vampirovibrio sp.]
MKQQENALPQGWELCLLKEVGDIISGGTPSTSLQEYWGDEVNWISPADLTGYQKKFIAKGAKSITLLGLQKSSAKLMPAGSIHFSSRAPIGYVVISEQPLSTNQGFKSIVPAQSVFNGYLYYYLKSIKQLANQLATGTTFKELSGTAFGKLPIPLPPLAEQKRIVGKIEALFSELDKGTDELRIAQAKVKQFRQALLKHAFSGRLTADWRADKTRHPECNETSPPPISGDPSLHSG